MSGRNLTTFVARANDGLMLVATIDNFDSGDLMGQAKKIVAALRVDSPAKCVMEGPEVNFSYLIDQGIIYLTVTEVSFPRFVIFEYLRELALAFSLEFGTSVPLFNRPFAAVSFDTTMDKIRRRFHDPQSAGLDKMQRLSSNLSEIQDIMSRNISDVINRGETLSEVERRSTQILADSRNMKKYARYANWMSMLKSWGPVAAAVVIVVFVLYFRFK